MRVFAPLIAFLLCGPLFAQDAKVNHLAATATSGTRDQREVALGALAQLDHARVGGILRRRFLDETDAGLRELAGFLLADRHVQSYYRLVEELVQDERKAHVGFLVKHAVSEDARYLRTLDVWAASSLDAGRTRALLTARIRGADVQVGLRAIELMALLGREADATAISARLTDRDAYVRIEALLALTKLRHVDCDAEIAKVAVTDASAHVRRHAVWALYERGKLKLAVAPHRESADGEVRRRAYEALAVERIKSLTEEGPFRFVYRGDTSMVRALFRRAEIRRPATVESADAAVRAKLTKTLAVLAERTPKFAFFVRHAFSRITTREDRPTGTYVSTRLFNIKASTVRKWNYDHLAKTLVHDATHAFLEELGEKSGEHRGEEECFQEAFWADRYLRGLKPDHYGAEVDRLLQNGHWAGHRRY